MPYAPNYLSKRQINDNYKLPTTTVLQDNKLQIRRKFAISILQKFHNYLKNKYLFNFIGIKCIPIAGNQNMFFPALENSAQDKRCGARQGKIGVRVTCFVH